MKESLRQEPGSHDATELVGGICHGNGCRRETTRLYAISCTKTGWSSLTHNRVLHQTLARSLARIKSSLLLKIHGLSYKELVDKRQTEPVTYGHHNGGGGTLRQPPTTQE